MEFFTIGVYGCSDKEFFKKLIDSDIDTFCDIRRRRGVRGSQYAFVNSKRLQEKLSNLDIKYIHTIDLSPTNEIRDLQKKADIVTGQQKKKREYLGEIFITTYREKILNVFNFERFLSMLDKQEEAKKIALFCVEEKANACHRSLVASVLRDLGYSVTDL